MEKITAGYRSSNSRNGTAPRAQRFEVFRCFPYCSVKVTQKSSESSPISRAADSSTPGRIRSRLYSRRSVVTSKPSTSVTDLTGGQRLQLYLYSTRNIAGCVLAFGGLGLLFGGVIHAYWW